MPCELILALDVPTREAAAPLLRRLRGSVPWVKIGLQLFTAYGPDYVRELAGEGFRIFLDLKLHDIPHTVARAVDSLSPLPIGMLTVHASGGREMLAAAQRQARPDLLLLGVTVLTSLDAAGLAETGVGGAPEAQVSRLAHLAMQSGLRGLVCSPLEVALLRSQVPAGVSLVTPGIRPAGGAPGDDQKRVLTPAAAARAGASHIVVGRPILQAPDPAAAARAIVAELASA
jgi:orotidine-5'-phosphate decarboxylase